MQAEHSVGDAVPQVLAHLMAWGYRGNHPLPDFRMLRLSAHAARASEPEVAFLHVP